MLLSYKKQEVVDWEIVSDVTKKTIPSTTMIVLAITVIVPNTNTTSTISSMY